MRGLGTEAARDVGLGDGATVLDGSNGTHVNDERVQEVQLRAGDRLQIGGTIMNFDALRLTRG